MPGEQYIELSDPAYHRRPGAAAAERAAAPERAAASGATARIAHIDAVRSRPRERYKLVVSDLHMGTGHRHGELNPWESFNEDARFADLLHHHASGPLADAEVELILNGDFFDLLQVPIDGAFPVRITEPLAVRKVTACMDGHPDVMAALATFLAMPRKSVTILPGNHDFEWVFPGVQEAFTERVCGQPTDRRVRVICDRAYYEFDGVHIEHGQQLELLHNHNFQELFLKDAGGEPILNLPWGTQFLLSVMMRLKEVRPYIDRVRPFKAYLIRALIFDPVFFFRTVYLSVVHFLKTRIFNWRHFGARMRQNWRLLTEAEVYPDLYGKVGHMLQDRPDIDVVILGHTHVPLVRRLPDGRVYVNGGCWTDTVSLDLGSFGQRSRPTYVFIEYPEDEPDRPSVKLRQWNGHESLFSELRY